MGLKDLSEDSSEDNGSDNSTKREYVQPTKEEFEKCIEDTGHEWEIDMKAPGKEYVYESHDFMPDHNGIVLRIYSTIDKRTDMARSKGADAIRLVVFNRHIMRPMGGRKKTLRIKTYCKNLRKKIESIFDQWDEYVTQCEECGGWMVIREGRYGEFLGCSNYPECDHTEQIE